MDFYQKVIALCKEKGVSRSKMADDIGISRSTPKDWETKKITPREGTVKKVADYFGVPVSYFFSDTGVENQTIRDNHGIIGQAYAPVTISNGSGHALSEQELALLDIFAGLSVMDRAKLLVFAEGLQDKNKQ